MPANNLISSAAFECGDYDKVIEQVLCKSFGGKQFDGDTFKEIERIYDEQGFSAAQEEIAHQLEVLAENNPIGFVEMALSYVRANQPDKAIDWIERGFEIHDPQMIYITVYQFDPLFDNPRFIEIVEKMNLPLPEE